MSIKIRGDDGNDLPMKDAELDLFAALEEYFSLYGGGPKAMIKLAKILKAVLRPSENPPRKTALKSCIEELEK